MKNFLQFLRRGWRLFLGSKLVWRRPPKSDLLIIDRGTASPLDKMFAHHYPHIMDIRGESINMPVLLRALPKVRLGAGAYLEAYIDFVKPKLVLSRTDNNHTLWQLKRRPDVTYQVALVQNGWRLDLESEIPTLLRPAPTGKRWHVDRVFSFGPTWLSQIARTTEVQGIAVGSLLLNNYEVSKTGESKNRIGIVSNYRSEFVKRGLDFGEILYRSLNQLLKKSGLPLTVVGYSGIDNRQDEYDFLASLLTEIDWKLASREFLMSSYETLRNLEIVIADVSSLGYEMLALGKRVGFIAAMQWSRQTHRFGKPLEFGEKGPFWTNDPSEAEIDRILNYLISVSDEQWERDSGWLRDQLMVHDYGNSKIRAYVEGVLADGLNLR